MLLTLTLMLLTRQPPNYDEKYVKGCYEYEDQPACDRRHERWNSDIKAYEDEVAEYEADDFKQLTGSKVTVDAVDGAARIGPLKPTWCEGVKPNSQWASMPRNLERFKEARSLDFGPLFAVAEMACKRPDDKDVQRFAGYAVQGYANLTHLSAEDAVRNFTLRMGPTLGANKKSLCGALTVDAEAMGPEKTFGETRRTFFGCGDDSISGQWSGNGMQYGFTQLLWYLDTASQPETELTRLAFLLDTVRTPAADYLYKEASAARYGWVQYDMKGLDTAKLMRELEVEPYKGNAFALVLVSESLGIYQANAKEFEAFVKKMAKDADWKRIVFDAPQKAAVDWEASAAKFKPAFEASKAFEDKLFMPSLKAAKGCSTKLRADFQGYLKTVKAKASDFDSTVASDPVGGLLLERLAACEAIEGNTDYSKVLFEVHDKGRVSRGPRLASYYATVEAIGDVVKDRPKFPLDPRSLWAPRSEGDLQTRADQAPRNSASRIGLGDSEGSIVKSVQKTPGGTKVVFITERYQFMSQSCTPTNRILRIHDGNVEYYMNCRDAGLRWAEQHMHDVLIPNDLATGITAGKWLEFAGDPQEQPPAMPRAVYTDKNKSKLVSWYGFAL
jgi:hypothetical protein